MATVDAGDLRAGRDRLARAVNVQQRKLVRAYDTWAASLKRELDAAIKSWASKAQLTAIVERHLPELETAMLGATHQGVQTAEKLVVGRDEITPRILAARNLHLLKNDELVSKSLTPFIGERLTAALTEPGIVDTRAVVKALTAQRSFPAQYAGGFWAMIFETKRAVGQDENEELRKQGLPPTRVRWRLDPEAEHCEASPGFYGCPDLAGEYESWDRLPTVPAGMTTCRGGCRCRIEVWRNGQWMS